MAKKRVPVQAKRKNQTDLTLRNLRALKKALAALAVRVGQIENHLDL